MADEPRVWIAQCLCPSRHVIMALAQVAETSEDAAKISVALRETVNGGLARLVMNPWCGHCHAPVETWHYEVNRTRFRTLEEAAPEIEKAQAEQEFIRLMFGT